MELGVMLDHMDLPVQSDLLERKETLVLPGQPGLGVTPVDRARLVVPDQLDRKARWARMASWGSLVP